MKHEMKLNNKAFNNIKSGIKKFGIESKISLKNNGQKIIKKGIY